MERSVSAPFRQLKKVPLTSRGAKNNEQCTILFLRQAKPSGARAEVVLKKEKRATFRVAVFGAVHDN
jgi:hypothetical protein